ncbi:POU domain, class 6, transcription factor 2 [Diorhabda sublineata]|nr:POU domain, class 6, transcription factor 2 [Diorhabda sublineata]
MAEGSVEEDNSDMLGPTLAPVLHTMQTSTPSNLSCKEEESDCESSIGSPEPAISAENGTDLTITSKQTHNRSEESSQTESKTTISMCPTSHINGAMAGLVTLQNLQNLASLQNLPQVASLAAGLTNMATLANNPVNAPLNLSVSASVTTPRSTQPLTIAETPPSIMSNSMNNQPPPPPPPAPASMGVPNSTLMGSQQPPSMPQFILASGQLVQGIQGAQLLIPTSQGLATQTILTIPVNHVNSSDQMVNLALNNGQVMQTSLANLQAMAQTNLISNATNPAPPTSNGTINPNLLNPATLTHLLSNGSTQQLLQSIPQLLSNNPHATHNTSPLINPLAQPHLPNRSPLISTSTLLSSSPTQTNQNRSQINVSNMGSSPLGSVPLGSTSMGTVPGHLGTSQSSHYVDTKMHGSNLGNIPRNPSPGENCSRVNGEISINTNHAGNSSHNMKRSPSSLSPNCTDNSTADLLVDSPNQPTINQTNSNVVDGINLDEIKDFAKAFKLRRLSLGLTQTQVGQALSVTEGPAYSQSAICSALASQMFAAAQLSSQQQAMFEKLDITPKSAQKIKPVLERWMKEAEDRYKSGQNHLTDFIGIEPSKKRKRRTSFTPQALELLNAHFERNTHPSGTEITGLAHQLGYEREVIRIWFCNKRQALKNTVRMMSKGMV